MLHIIHVSKRCLTFLKSFNVARRPFYSSYVSNNLTFESPRSRWQRRCENRTVSPGSAACFRDARFRSSRGPLILRETVVHLRDAFPLSLNAAFFPPQIVRLLRASPVTSVSSLDVGLRRRNNATPASRVIYTRGCTRSRVHVKARRIRERAQRRERGERPYSWRH